MALPSALAKPAFGFCGSAITCSRIPSVSRECPWTGEVDEACQVFKRWINARADTSRVPTIFNDGMFDCVTKRVEIGTKQNAVISALLSKWVLTQKQKDKSSLKENSSFQS